MQQEGVGFNLSEPQIAKEVIDDLHSFLTKNVRDISQEKNISFLKNGMNNSEVYKAALSLIRNYSLCIEISHEMRSDISIENKRVVHELDTKSFDYKGVNYKQVSQNYQYYCLEINAKAFLALEKMARECGRKEMTKRQQDANQHLIELEEGNRQESGHPRKSYDYDRNQIPIELQKAIAESEVSNDDDREIKWKAHCQLF